jgi:hypothetical protein
MTVSERFPVTGLAVNITPATTASTICCTTTASWTLRGSMAFVARYDTARFVHSDAQQRWTASSTASDPTMFK